MKKDNIAIIGLGYWGTIVTNTIVSMNIFKKIYIYDNDIEKINILKKKFKNKIIVSNFDSIKNNRKINNIFLATPPKNNFNILKILIRSKKNILIEKPGLTNLKNFRIWKLVVRVWICKFTFGASQNFNIIKVFCRKC